MQSTERIRNALDQAGEYLDGRQCDNGGFCFYRTRYVQEPNVHDTYYALAAYRLLQRPMPNRPQILKFLFGQPAHSHQPYYLYYHVYSLRLLGKEPAVITIADIEALPFAVPDRREGFSGWLDQAIKITRMKRDFCGQIPDAAKASFIGELHQEGGYGARPNLKDTFVALRLLDKMDTPTRDADTVRFVQDMQIPSLGFRNTRDSLYTNNSILHAGVGCCMILDIPVRYPDAITSAVLAAQSRDGAFAPVTQSLPDLHSHYLGIKLIKVLDALFGARAEYAMEILKEEAFE